MKENFISNKTNSPVKINMEIVFDHANNCGSLVINGNPIKIHSGFMGTSDYGDELSICLTDQHYCNPGLFEIRIPYHLIEQAGLMDIYAKQLELGYFPIWYQNLYGFDFDEKNDWREWDIFHVDRPGMTQQHIALGQVNQFPKEEEEMIENWCQMDMVQLIAGGEYMIERRINEIGDNMKIHRDSDSPLTNYKHQIEVLEKCKKHLEDIEKKCIQPYECSLSQESEEE